MGTHDDVAIRFSNLADHVFAASTKILHLDFGAHVFQLLRDVFGGSCGARRSGVPAFARGIGEPGDVSLEAIDGDGGNRDERDEKRGKDNDSAVAGGSHDSFTRFCNASNATTYALNPTSRVI